MDNDNIEVEIEADSKDHRHICKKYWTVDGDGEFECFVKDIQQEFDLTQAEVLEIVRAKSLVYSHKTECSRCGKAKRFTSRTELKKYINRSYNISRFDKPYYCDECKEIAAQERKEKREQLQTLRRETVRETYFDYPITEIDFTSLSLSSATYLLALYRVGAQEDLRTFNPTLDYEKPLTPGKLFDFELLVQLFEQGYIAVHPESNMEAFKFEDEETEDFQYYPEKVHWQQTFAYDLVQINNVISQLEQRFNNMDWPEHWLEQAEPLWKKIAFHEVKEYLIHVLQEHGIRHEPGEKTSQVIDSLLENFSVAQIHSMIWSKAKATASWLSRTRAPKQRAPNYLLSAIQGYGDKIMANDWNVNKFSRNYHCNISAVAEIFYNKVIQTNGFQKVPKL